MWLKLDCFGSDVLRACFDMRSTYGRTIWEEYNSWLVVSTLSTTCFNMSTPLIDCRIFVTKELLDLSYSGLFLETSRASLQQGLQPFFSGTKPPFGRTDSGAFSKNSSSGVGKGKLSGQGCRASHRESSQRCPCWKKRPTPEAGERFR